MKCRFGFVSNSSSSSFIVHKSEFPDEKSFGDVIRALEEFKEYNSTIGEFEEWGENGTTFDVEGDYLLVEMYYVTTDIVNLFKKCGVDFKTLKGIRING